LNEPNLRNIDDYYTLQGEKKKVIGAIIIASIIMSIVYAVAVSLNTHEEPTSIDKTFQKVPMR